MSDDEEADIAEEERAIYLIVAIAGIPVVIGALLEGGMLDAGSTVSLACVVFAVVGLAGLVARMRKPRLPKATLLARETDNPRPPP